MSRSIEETLFGMIEFRGTMPSLRVLEINKEKMISHRRFSFEPLFSVSWLLRVICLITDHWSYRD